MNFSVRLRVVGEASRWKGQQLGGMLGFIYTSLQYNSVAAMYDNLTQVSVRIRQVSLFSVSKYIQQGPYLCFVFAVKESQCPKQYI